MTRGPIHGRLAALLAIVAIVTLACGSAGGSPTPRASTPAPATTAAASPTAATTTAAPSATATATAEETSAAPSATATAGETSAAPSATATAGETSAAPSGSAPTTGSCAGAEPGQFFDQAECEAQLALRSVTPEGPADKPWEQMLEPDLADTSQFKKDGPHKICFSNAGVNNPWRVVGYETMQAEVDIQVAAGTLAAGADGFVHVDAGGDDNKQISDIQDLLANGNCSALIISPNTTLALTPAVEAACQTSIPIIVFDRGVTSDCPVTFIKPIGGYAYGADAAEFLAENVQSGGNILALRILPGVDVLETRFSAAKAIFSQKGLNLVGAEFTEGNPATTKTIVTDFLGRGTIDGVWMDAGATSVGAIEAFEDAGKPVPPITGEDQQDFLRKWKTDGLTAIAPTYPTYQWRTAIIAAVKVLAGEQVPKHWNLPQPKITAENLDQYLKEGLPDLHYALCGCEGMPDFPQRWLTPGP